MSGKRKYYWDTDCFLAWLNGKEEGKTELADGIVSEVNSGKAVIITSVNTITEIFEGSFTEGQKKKFKHMIGRREVALVNVDHNVADLARRLREDCKRQGKALRTPDAQHLATAILHGADEFHTFDEKLLNKSGDLAGHTIKICKPESIQRGLPFSSDDSATQD